MQVVDLTNEWVDALVSLAQAVDNSRYVAGRGLDLLCQESSLRLESEALILNAAKMLAAGWRATSKRHPKLFYSSKHLPLFKPYYDQSL